MAEYIKREYAIKTHCNICRLTCVCNGNEACCYEVKAFKRIPAADVVEVVRCGECEWWTKLESSCQGRCERYGIYPTAAWYCAAGTKMDKEDENNEV